MMRRVFLIVCILMALFTGVAFAAEKGVTMTIKDANGNSHTFYNVYSENGTTYGSETPDGPLGQRRNLDVILREKGALGDNESWYERYNQGTHTVDEHGNVQRTAQDIKDAAANGIKILNDIEKKFDEASNTAISRLRGPAKSLLLMLAVISLVSNWSLYEGQLRLSFVAETVLKVGFFFFLLGYWGTITADIGNSFKNAGILAAFGNADETIKGSGHVLALGFECIAELWKNISVVDTVLHPIDSIVRVVGIFCVLIGHLLLAFEMLVTRIEWAIFRCLSLIFLPLGVLRFTSNFFSGTIRGMFSYGAKLMVINFLVGLIFQNTMIANTKLGESSTTAETLCTGFVFLVLAWLVRSAGGLAQSLVSGSPSLSGASLKGTMMGLAAGATGMVVGAGAKAAMGGVAPSPSVANATTGASVGGALGGSGLNLANFQQAAANGFNSLESVAGNNTNNDRSEKDNDSQTSNSSESKVTPTPSGKPEQQAIEGSGTGVGQNGQNGQNIESATHSNPQEINNTTNQSGTYQGTSQQGQGTPQQGMVGAAGTTSNKDGQSTTEGNKENAEPNMDDSGVKEAVGTPPPVNDGPNESETGNSTEESDQPSDLSGVQGEGRTETVETPEQKVQREMEELRKNNPEAYEYAMAASKVLDENGQLRKDASMQDKIDYVQKRTAWESKEAAKQEAIKSYEKQQKEEANLFFGNRSKFDRKVESWNEGLDKRWHSDSVKDKAIGAAGKTVMFGGRFAKEMAIQGLVMAADSVLDAAQTGVARRDRYERFKSGQWKENGGIVGQMGTYFNR